jgi:hypothetical protein
MILQLEMKQIFKYFLYYMMSADNSSEIIHLLNEINTNLNNINTKIDFCCGNYNKAAEDIQKVYRGHTSRRNTRRTMRPNITESLFTMPKEVGDRINELIPETRRQIKERQQETQRQKREQERLERERKMPMMKTKKGRHSNVVPSGPFSGQRLEEALLQLLIDDPNYDIESWARRIFAPTAADVAAINAERNTANSNVGSGRDAPQRRRVIQRTFDARIERFQKQQGIAVEFARRFKIWYHKYYLPKIGGKRKKKKTRKKKR